ncbi:hypothetical protein RRG08_063879, partial [Elysia crispata]
MTGSRARCRPDSSLNKLGHGLEQ